MQLPEALEIVLELAQQNALAPEECGPDLIDECERQDSALDVCQTFLDKFLKG